MEVGGVSFLLFHQVGPAVLGGRWIRVPVSLTAQQERFATFSTKSFIKRENYCDINIKYVKIWNPILILGVYLVWFSV